MGLAAVATLTPAEYLEVEANSTMKHEYFDGYIVAMAGASYAHNLIFKNTYGQLSSLLKGKGCNPFGSDLRVQIDENSFIYPDITVICKAPNLTFSNPPNLLNPSLIVEILSASTEADDRFLKLPRLMQMATLNEIVFISSERMAIEHYVRRGTEWVVTPLGPGPDSILTLSSLSISIPIADIYEEVDFTPAAAPKQG